MADGEGSEQGASAEVATAAEEPRDREYYFTSDQSPRAMSPTHRLPRPYVKPKAGGEFMNPATAGSFSNSEDERNSPRSRSRLSTSYSAEEDTVDPEHSILVLKTPRKCQDVVSPRHHLHHDSKRVSMSRTAAARSEPKVRVDKQQQTSPTMRQPGVPRVSDLTVGPNPGVATSNGTATTHQQLLSPFLPAEELEMNLRQLSPQQLVSAYLELSETVKRMERHAELREELLRRSQRQLENRDRTIKEKDNVIRKMERIDEEPEDLSFPGTSGLSFKDGSAVQCRFTSSGCKYRLPSMEYHEERECRFRPTRCPSLTCPIQPPYAKLLEHIKEQHDGATKGRDRICRNDTNHLVSSYVNIDKEPVFYKSSKMTWVANELVCEGRHFFLECMRSPPDWHIWMYLLGSEKEAEQFQTNIQLFKEAEYARKEYSAQRSYTGPVISIHRSKEEIAELSLGFQVHDKQIRSLCGPISNQEEQLFGYEVTVYRK